MAVLAWAVQAAHEAGIVHRDLKPDNVLLATEVSGSPDNVLGGFPKVTDFGLAALVDRESRTLEGELFGTPAYMAPEQAAGKTREVGPPADVWALGVILYRCLTGTLPFKDDGIMDTLDRVKAMQFAPPHEVRADVPRELEAACLACLQRSPSERPTARQLAERLQRFATGQGRQPTVPRSRRPFWFWLASAACLLIVGLGIAWLVWPPGQDKRTDDNQANERPLSSRKR